MRAGGPGSDLSETTNNRGCPVLRAVCEGREFRALRAGGFFDSSYTATKRNRGPTHIHLYCSGFPEKVETIAAPSPLFRRIHQSAFERIAMHVSQFLHAFFRSPDVEIVETCLPERPWLRGIGKEAALSRILPLALGDASAMLSGETHAHTEDVLRTWHRFRNKHLP